MSNFQAKIQAFFNRRLVKHGIPFMILVVGGSFGLREFAQIRYTYARTSAVSREDIKKAGVEMKKAGEVTMESEYEKIKDMDIDNWEQVRGPRPWEEQPVKN